MIFAKIDVSFPRHHRLLSIRSENGRKRDSVSARMARAAALGVWTAALCYTRDQMLNGFCPISAIGEYATEDTIDELVARGLVTRTEQDGATGITIVNYSKFNEMRVDIERRLAVDRARKIRVDSSRTPPEASARNPRSESESESETESETELRELPSQAPARQRPRTKSSADHAALIAHFAAEFERLKGVRPVIGAKDGAGAKKLLEGRSLEDAKAIVDRAPSDPWWLDNNPDLAAIAGKINSFIGRRAMPQTPLQPSGGAWKKAEVSQ